MKKKMLIVLIALLCSQPLLSFADTIQLSWKEACNLMDQFEDQYQGKQERKALEKENAQRTREWEKEYGHHLRWQGDLTAEYMQKYGMMPTYNAPYANPMAVIPGPDTLGVDAARTLAMEAVLKVEPRLTRSKLETMFSTWEFCYSRDLGWFWEPTGTWYFAWYSDTDKIVCNAYVSDCDRKVTIVFDHLDCHDPYDDSGLMVFTDF